jgi:hypothetical protein
MTITRDSLLTLEAYAKVRPEMRTRIIGHKKNRTVRLGNHLTILFEDEATVRYQIQEMLHIEKIFDEDGILAELEAYLPLVPDGSNLKATLQIEYENVAERRAALARLIGVEDHVYIHIEGEPPVYPVADEDLPRDNAEKTSAVHFLRFELTDSMCHALKRGARLLMGCDHAAYGIHEQPVPEAIAGALARDLR